MITITPNDVTPQQLQTYLQGAIGPRPIALASTMDVEGNPNVSPFSFFNIFSSNPPILVFSPARRVRNNTTKHTLENVLTTKEVVINIVNYNIVEQQSLASTEYELGVNEFIKAGLTMLPSEVVKPFRVQESPVQFECVVNEVIALGDNGGAGNLVICEIKKMHISESILDANGTIDPIKIDLVARMGGNWYSRAKDGLFEVEKPLTTLGIGVDAIPDFIKKNSIFTGNDLGKLGNVEKLPDLIEIEVFITQNKEIQDLINTHNKDQIFALAKSFLDKSEVTNAWKTLLAINNL